MKWTNNKTKKGVQNDHKLGTQALYYVLITVDNVPHSLLCALSVVKWCAKCANVCKTVSSQE